MISPQSFSSLLSFINLAELPPTQIGARELLKRFAKDRLRDLVGLKIQQSGIDRYSQFTKNQLQRKDRIGLVDQPSKNGRNKLSPPT
jgi:hypothetical protein